MKLSKSAYLLFFVGGMIFTGCKTVHTPAPVPEKQQETSELLFPRDRESVYVSGIEVPVFREPTFEAALREAVLEMGNLYNAYFIWKEEIYDLNGEKIVLN